MAAPMPHIAGLRLLICVLVLTLSTLTSCEEYDFDAAPYPGLQHDLRFELPAGDTQCFFQKIKQGATLYTSFEVVKGADRNIDYRVYNPDGTELESQLWTSQGETNNKIENEGVYKFCVDNSHSRFSSKVVFMYILAYDMNDWSKHDKDIEDFDDSVGNVTAKLDSVSGRVNIMNADLIIFSRKYRMDYYQVVSNFTLVKQVSIGLSSLIVLTSLFQVYFVRRLFRTTKVTPDGKPRA